MEKSSTKKKLADWGFSFILSAPVLIFLLAYFFNHSKDIIPTGFIQYDNVSYVGNAQQLLNNHSGLFYANRLNDSNNYPRIYFQPQHLILATMMKAGLSPGIALCFFVYIFSVLFFRVLISFYDHLHSLSRHRMLILILFSWGGGVLALSGWLLFLIHLSPAKDMLASGLVLDPSAGWWGLNTGRSLFFSMEAFYHVLFFSGMYCILKKKWMIAALAAFLLSLSHPFTGLEFLAIICFWLFIEKTFYRNMTIPWKFVFFIVALTAFHIWLYLIHLNQFPEHKIVFSQYQLNWKLRFYNMLPAYIIVAILAIFNARRAASPKSFLASANTRLFISWLTVALVLANHELFIKGIQPLHFTRGYIWASLFLLAIPTIESVIDILLKNSRRKILLGVCIFLFLLDNINWISLNSRYTSSPSSVSYIDVQQKKVLDFLGQTTTENTLIIGSDKTLPYLSTVYAPAYSWISHVYNTPFYDEKLDIYNTYLQKGTISEKWFNRDLLFIVDKNNPDEINRYTESKSRLNKVFESGDYILYRYPTLTR